MNLSWLCVCVCVWCAGQRETENKSGYLIMKCNPHANLYTGLRSLNFCAFIKLLKPTGHVMHHQFNIQQLYVLPTLYLCVLYLSENKQRLVPLTA